MRSTFSETMELGRAKALVFGAAMMVAILLELLLAANPAYASTFTVINTDDTGAGSLRQAITDANNDNAPTVDTINSTSPAPTPTATP